MTWSALLNTAAFIYFSYCCCYGLDEAILRILFVPLKAQRMTVKNSKRRHVGGIAVLRHKPYVYACLLSCVVELYTVCELRLVH